MIETTFAERARSATLFRVRGLALLFISGGLLLWPLDLFFFRSQPKLLAAEPEWRIPAVVACTIAFLLLRTRLSRYPVQVTAVTGWILLAAAGRAFAGAGGVGEPYSLACYLAPLAASVLSVELLPRFLLAASFSIAYFAGFALRAPHELASQEALAAYGASSFSVLVSALAGHALHRSLHRGWQNRRALANSAEALAHGKADVDEANRQLAEANANLARLAEARNREIAALIERTEALRESERTRIARDLHDELGQALSALRIELDLIELAKPAARAEAVKRALELVEAIRGSYERIVWEVEPVQMTRSFAEALRELARRTQNSTLSCQVILDERLSVPAAQAAALFRIVQEALTNVLRHAQARNVVIRVTCDEKLRLAVEDDGRGIDVSESPTGHFGLVGMRERARLCDGTIRIERRADGGSRVICELPIGKEATA